MISNNKILTVSYGTFSCTLEGFDDSFGTMKAIAEYFRDLASDDRYFGAEPPVPDAEMLARIAEREIERRVQAHMNDGRIVLSAAPVAASTPDSHVTDASVAEPTGTDAIGSEPGEDTPAAQMSTDKQTEDQAKSVAEEEDAHDNIDDAFDSADATDILDVAAAAALEAGKEPAVDLLNDTAEDLETAEAFFAAAPADAMMLPEDDEAADEIVSPHSAAAAAPKGDSISDKLQRIRAVVSQADDDDLDDEYSEDEHAEDLVSDVMSDDTDLVQDLAQTTADRTEDDVMTEAAAEVTAALEADDAAAESVDEDDEDDDIAAILARLDRDEDDEETLVDIPSTQEDTDAMDTHIEEVASALHDADTSDDLVAQDAEDDDGDAENLFDVIDAEMDGMPDEAVAEETLSDDAEAEDVDKVAREVTEAVAEDGVSTHKPRLARVVKVKRADLEAAIAEGSLEEISDDLEDLDIEETSEGSSLSAEDEEELMRELAAVEAEQQAADQDAGDTEDVQEDTAEDPDRIAASLDGTDDTDVDRLMAQADREMGEPESARNRNAFAHLRAAVAARNSDTGISDAAAAVEEVQPYQSDLADVVKPRRPVASDRGSADRRPEANRPAPLKLVAEQRVVPGDGAQASTGPVRPRRVAAAPVASDSDDNSSFAEFAEDMGAHGLPDLLEAAAAYLAFVEDRDHFSRPQLMTKVRQVVGSDFSREDGLRSFGQLLRAGKIEKIKGGRFVVSGDIGFRPDHRAAG